MQAWILALFASVALFTSTAFSETDEQEPASECQQIVASLEGAHGVLYDVDTRPLEINEYRSYRDALTQLQGQTEKLNQLCNKSPDEKVVKNIVTSEDVSWQVTNSYDNPCSSVSTIDQKFLSNFEETAIRACYSDGYEECLLKAPARAFNLISDKVSNLTWKCTVSVDVVITGQN